MTKWNTRNGTNSDMRIAAIGTYILFAVVIAYGLFRSQTILFGPQLTILAPEPHSSVPQIFTVEAVTKNATYLTINDQRVYPDRNGYFEQDLLLPTGYTIVKVYAKNRQNREKIIHLPLYITHHDNREKTNKENEEQE